jgi:hypothetical protein
MNWQYFKPRIAPASKASAHCKARKNAHCVANERANQLKGIQLHCMFRITNIATFHDV